VGSERKFTTFRASRQADFSPAIGAAAGKLRASTFTADGEAVVCGPDGVAVFDDLYGQRRLGEAFLYAFDLMELNGEDLRSCPYSDRKRRLGRLLARQSAGIIVNDHIEADGAVVFAEACRMGLEGIVPSGPTPPTFPGDRGTGSRPRTPTVRLCAEHPIASAGAHNRDFSERREDMNRVELIEPTRAMCAAGAAAMDELLDSGVGLLIST
jgi:hypothetical protein